MERKKSGAEWLDQEAAGRQLNKVLHWFSPSFPPTTPLKLYRSWSHVGCKGTSLWWCCCYETEIEFHTWTRFIGKHEPRPLHCNLILTLHGGGWGARRSHRLLRAALVVVVVIHRVAVFSQVESSGWYIDDIVVSIPSFLPPSLA